MVNKASTDASSQFLASSRHIDVARKGENLEFPLPHGTHMDCMQSLNMANCPRMSKVTPCLTSPSEIERDKIGFVLPMQKQSSLTDAHGTLLRPRLHDTHTNRLGPIPHTILSREPVSLTSKFHAHEPLPCPRPILLDEEPRAIMEPLVDKEFKRQERELCDNPSAPTIYNSMELDDPHPQSTTSPQATLSNSTLEANQGVCPSSVHNASLPSPIGQTKEYLREL